MHDIETIAALFHIHEKASAHGMAFTNIRDAAMRELLKLNEAHAVKKESTHVETTFDGEVPPDEEHSVDRRDLA